MCSAYTVFTFTKSVSKSVTSCKDLAFGNSYMGDLKGERERGGGLGIMQGFI